ncbi:MAG: anion permease [Clostridiales Family XIII bacterium]|jgi:di/tricarboxylate transporter|nr:anion permease [Clostridiales Family XIII bacterium]
MNEIADKGIRSEQLEPVDAAGAAPGNGAYYAKAFIGLAIMVFFQFIPAPAPITAVGMALLGYFIGLILLWSLVDMVWPTFIAICLFAFQAQEIYPGSYQMAGIYESGIQSFGNWITLFVLGTLVLCQALDETGTIRRITMWFLTRDFAKKSPWNFTFMLWLSGLVVALFLDVTVAQIFMIKIAHELFKELGFRKGDAWPRTVIIGITFTAILGFTMTPICHTLPILFTGISASITGQPVNLLTYMLVGIPVGFVIWIVMYFWFKLFVKPDVSQFERVDFAVIDAKRPGPMDAREKAVVTISVIVLLAWIIPGFLSFLAPSAGITATVNALTATFPLFAGIAAMGFIRIGGRPLLDIEHAFRSITWLPIILLAGIMMVAGAMGEATTGIPDWIAANVVPLSEGLSPFLVVAVIAISCIVLTNIANNVPVGIIFVSVGTPMAVNMGVNPAILAVTVSIAANLAYTIPPAYVPIGFAYADPYCNGGSVFRNGVVMALVSIVVSALLIYPLGALFFGA